tara:strand:- start:2101 stop:5238 length:3138 start_codon:yes stop_codon:yes gene_type:complete
MNTPSSNEPNKRQVSHGPIAWMVHNRVPSNLLMLLFVIGGLLMTTQIKQEVFPEFSTDSISISVTYPGASPEEVEKGIILVLEEAVRGIEGIDETTATANEGSANLILDLDTGTDQQKAYQDVQQAVDRILTFPLNAEEPQINMSSRKRSVLAIQLYGNASEWVLREVAEQVRENLLQSPQITQVEMSGTRNYEIHIEISQENLRAYGLTLGQVAAHISQTAIELPGGSIKTEAGEILVRLSERKDWAAEFESISIITTANGTRVNLSDIADISEGFEDSNRLASFNGLPSVQIEVFRIAAQTPISISDAVKSMLADIQQDLPPGISVSINRDRSDIYRQRLDLLLKNAFLGLLLVIVLLGVFLDLKLAFWVTMGITTSFLGAFLLLPIFGASINMISMFAFIISLGIVVDDAIVAGENIFEYRQSGMNSVDAAIKGAQDIASPVSFSILTNIAAFSPMLFVPGFIGKVWFVIPLVVGSVFIISWIEALFILPAHLAYSTETKPKYALTRFLHQQRTKFNAVFNYFVQHIFASLLTLCLRARYLTLAIGIGILISLLAYVASGRMGMVLMPKVESDRSVVSATLPYGSPSHKVIAVRDRLIESAREIIDENGAEKLSMGIYADINENTVEVTVYLTPPDTRPISTGEVTRLWRDRTGQISGVEILRFESDHGGPGRGPALTVELNHRDINVLDRAGKSLAETLSGYDFVKDIDDGFSDGKQQLDFKLKPEGRSLGLTTRDVAEQIRHAFYGANALRQQRGRNEVKVLVRRPESERISEYDIAQLLIRTPAGTDVPLYEIASVSRGRAYSSIIRHEGRRSINVTAAIEPQDKSEQIINSLKADVLPQLQQDYPGLNFSFEGRQADFRDSLKALGYGFLIVFIILYSLLAIPLGSYMQPTIIISAIPFGIVGAILGHMIMGYSISIISMMGIIALSGVVINDSLIMIEYANRLFKKNQDAVQSITQSALRRFRPILLTTLTTFGGLAPMIFETSRQARFMIPMAISLGFGILFATAIILLIVPCLFMVVEDIRGLATSKEPLINGTH